ncbi:hypothetical protein D5R81_04855 [Parashewanella spongiae]|uniref:Uncharacterized protein n=1 Tax=Parashewanella spongiae TaxID=342950 RepID=A0A3A6U3C9_9GAMM|nr:VPA1267 family protein [Parashewanella spongiae]MCL1077274.1 hypothetical protein [Parashewanella spongiae]RJY18545.1 hypothetical protein D5R81_04855 [Parashewanella spongiae]
MSQQNNIDKFLAWKASISKEDLTQMVYRGRLNRSIICKEAGIGRTAFKTNSQLIQLIDEFEDYLSHQGVLGNKTKSPKGSVADVDRNIFPIRDLSAAKIAQLERVNGKLTQQVLELKAELSKLQELKEVVSEMGLLSD